MSSENSYNVRHEYIKLLKAMASVLENKTIPFKEFEYFLYKKYSDKMSLEDKIQYNKRLLENEDNYISSNLKKTKLDHIFKNLKNNIKTLETERKKINIFRFIKKAKLKEKIKQLKNLLDRYDIEDEKSATDNYKRLLCLFEQIFALSPDFKRLKFNNFILYDNTLFKLVKYNLHEIEKENGIEISDNYYNQLLLLCEKLHTLELINTNDSKIIILKFLKKD